MCKEFNECGLLFKRMWGRREEVRKKDDCFNQFLCENIHLHAGPFNEDVKSDKEMFRGILSKKMASRHVFLCVKEIKGVGFCVRVWL